jgi:hypothetical protein
MARRISYGSASKKQVLHCVQDDKFVFRMTICVQDDKLCSDDKFVFRMTNLCSG